MQRGFEQAFAGQRHAIQLVEKFQQRVVQVVSVMERHLEFESIAVTVDMAHAELREMHRLDLLLGALRAAPGSARLGQQQAQGES